MGVYTDRRYALKGRMLSRGEGRSANAHDSHRGEHKAITATTLSADATSAERPPVGADSCTPTREVPSAAAAAAAAAFFAVAAPAARSVCGCRRAALFNGHNHQQ